VGVDSVAFGQHNKSSEADYAEHKLPKVNRVRIHVEDAVHLEEQFFVGLLHGAEDKLLGESKQFVFLENQRIHEVHGFVFAVEALHVEVDGVVVVVAEELLDHGIVFLAHLRGHQHVDVRVP